MWQHDHQWLSAAALQIGLVLVAACLLAVRGAVGCVALYTQRKYEKWWDNDKCAPAHPYLLSAVLSQVLSSE